MTPTEPPSACRRRALLQALGASGFLAAWAALAGGSGAQTQTGADTPASGIRLAHDPFTCGVASGAPSRDGMVLWTRLDPRALPPGADGQALVDVTLQWEVAQDEHFRQEVQRGSGVAQQALGYSVHVEPQGLASNRWYFYRFRLGDAVSRVGRTRTLPEANAALQSLRLAYASCQKWEDGYFAAWRHMAAEGVDGVLFLGDYLYEYPALKSRVRVPPGGWMLTLDEYRARYALYKSDPDLQAMHAAAPWWVIWDDHEVQNDYAGLQAGDSGPTSPEVADFAQRRAAAYQAYFENMPLRRSALIEGVAGLGRGAEMRIYSQARFGTLASLLMLDTRQYKDPQPCGAPGKTGSAMFTPAFCKTWPAEGRSLLGRAQEQWVDQTLASPSVQEARWTLLGQTTLLGQRDFGTGRDLRLWNDGWDGYPAARQRLLGSLQRHRVPNPVVLGGDVHEHWVGHVKADYNAPDSASVAVEFCGAGITSHAGNSKRSAEQLARNPHFIYAEAEHRGYGVLDLTPQRLSVRLRGLDDATRKDSAIQTLASFEVEAGRAQVRRTDPA